MIFCEFAQKLSSVIQGPIRNGSFAYTLFEVLLPTNKRGEIEFNEDTFRRYYNGSSSIKRIAKKIYADASMASFERFINDYGKNARTKLSEVFSDEFADITPDNAGKLLFELFLEIIRDAAEDNDESLEIIGEDESPEIIENDKSPETIEAEKKTVDVHQGNIHAHITQQGTNCLTITSYAPMSLTFPSGGGGAQ